MYEVIWTDTATYAYLSNLEYWNNRNKSISYSQKIIAEIDNINEFLAKTPYDISKYHKKVDIYQYLLMKGRFSIFYEIDEENKKVFVKHFRSNRQEPLH